MDPWQARNIGKVTMKGVECEVNHEFPSLPFLERLQWGYTYINAGNNQYAFSKYLYDYNRHKWVLNIHFSGKLFYVDIGTRLVRTEQRGDYITTDIKIKKPLSPQCTLFLSGTNIFNEQYDELTDVGAEGRWWRIGMEWAF